MSLENILSEREATHGDYADVAWISQTMKSTLRAHGKWPFLDFPMAQSLDLMCGKIARIVAGDELEKDHWLDIQGYAQLALREIEKGEANHDEQSATSYCGAD